MELRWVMDERIQYLIYQKEQGESGTPHFQGYVEFTSRVTFRQAKTVIHERAHLERRRGNAVQARDYCKKEDGRLDGPWEFGTGDFSGLRQSTAGERTDLSTIRDLLIAGRPERDIADEFFSQWCRYHAAFRRYRLMCLSHRSWKTRTTVVVGPPGTGKSKYAMDLHPSAYWKQRSIWWDNYEAHDAVVIDDFYGWMPYDTLLRLCDRYPLLIETKGGQTIFLAKTIIITSNNTPAQWYKNVNLKTFIRRVDLWIYLGLGGLRVETENYDEFCNAVDRNFIN